MTRAAYLPVAAPADRSPGMRAALESLDELTREISVEKLHAHLAELAAAPESLTDRQREQLTELASLVSRVGMDLSPFQSMRCDGVATFEPSADRMAMFMDLKPPIAGGEPVTVEAVIDALAQRGVMRGLDEAAIAKACQQAADGSEVRGCMVALGCPACRGQQSRVEYFGRTSPDGPCKPLEQEAISRMSDDAWFCEPGDCIAVYHPPVAGSEGFDVFGKPLANEASQVLPPRVGHGVEAKDNQYIAEYGGVVKLSGNSLSIRKQLVIRQDLTARNSPVHFDGDVLVQAAVRSGAKLHATGSIRVSGNVEAAHIESTQGDVTLAHGVTGQGEAVIIAGRDVHARFVEHALVRAGRDLIIDVGAIHARLFAGQNLRCMGARGQIVGGSVMAGDMVQAQQIGAATGLATEVVVGLAGGLMQHVHAIDASIDQLTARVRKCQAVADQIQRLVGDPARLPADAATRFVRLREMEIAASVQVDRHRRERNDLLKQATEHTDARVEVHQQLFSNVEVRVGHLAWRADKPRRHCRIRYSATSKQIIISGLR